MKYRWATALNHAVARTLLHAGASPNQEGDRTGGVNKIFKYAYAIRHVGKKLKSATGSSTTPPSGRCSP